MTSQPTRRPCKNCSTIFFGRGVQRYCSAECVLSANSEKRESGCIIWTGVKDRNGYGRIAGVYCGTRLAHSASLAQKLGRRVKLNALHICDNPSCINPDHLYEGTQADNVRDMYARNRMPPKDYCRKGHPYSPENSYFHPNSSKKECRTCRRDRRPPIKGDGTIGKLRPEQREWAVRAVSSGDKTRREVAGDLGVTPEAISYWLRKLTSPGLVRVGAPCRP